MRKRSRTRVFGWFAAAAFVALALAPSAIVDGVVAAGATPTPIAAGHQQAEADPTPTPEPTPSPSPSPAATPTQIPTPTPTPTTYRAFITVGSVIDADGNLDTDGDPEFEEDQTLAKGWEFAFETDATITNSSGGNEWEVTYGPGGASVTLTEDVQGGFQLLDAYCDVVVSGDDIVGELNGTSLTFQLQVVEEGTGFYTCRFFNTPTSSPGGDTTSPPSGTLPPTDTGRPASTPDLGSRSATTVLLAAILAAVLISTLMVRADRTDSRRR